MLSAFNHLLLVLLTISEFLGHFHPLIVHLPIGILLIALLLQWLAKKEKYKTLQPAVAVALLVGAITALLSCITGYILSTTDDYDATLISYHMTSAIVLTVVSFVLYVKEKNPKFEVPKNALAMGLFLLIFLTGHLGGSLTHGSDYLTKPLAELFSNDSSASLTIKPIPNVEEAMVYSDVVKPILATRCYSCHGEAKQKGGLRMDDSLKLMKGGKDGIVITKGDAKGSELTKRIALSLENDDHMPPKEKPQLTKDQVALLHWWIDNGADMNAKVKDIKQSSDIKQKLLVLQTVEKKKEEVSDIPASPVTSADEKTIDKLREQHILVIPVAQGNNYLMASFINDTIVTKEKLMLLQQLSPQLVWLKLANTNVDDSLMPYIGKLNNLTKLDVSNTSLTDKSIRPVASLLHLRYLNLVNTNVTTQGILSLKNISSLTFLFLYKNKIGAPGYTQLKMAFPKTNIDTGGYFVPTLPTDTTDVKVAKKDK